jgi:hypothetical protein
VHTKALYDIYLPGLPARLRVPHCQVRVDPDKDDESSQQESSNVSPAAHTLPYIWYHVRIVSVCMRYCNTHDGVHLVHQEDEKFAVEQVYMREFLCKFLYFESQPPLSRLSSSIMHVYKYLSFHDTNAWPVCLICHVWEPFLMIMCFRPFFLLMWVIIVCDAAQEWCVRCHSNQ